MLANLPKIYAVFALCCTLSTRIDKGLKQLNFAQLFGYQKMPAPQPNSSTHEKPQNNILFFKEGKEMSAIVVSTQTNKTSPVLVHLKQGFQDNLCIKFYY